MPELTRLLDKLEGHYGPQAADWPTDPFLFLVWWHCGYPSSDVACGKGWESLTKLIEITPEEILSLKDVRLPAALKPGGMVPELRAIRLKEIADRILNDFGGDLAGALQQLPAVKARSTLKKFPGIADAGADRILLFAGISPIAAIPSNRAEVLVRIEIGTVDKNWNRTYQAAQKIVEAETAAKFDARQRAYLLLKRHGQEICKAKPQCGLCPVADSCAFVKATGKRRPS